MAEGFTKIDNKIYDALLKAKLSPAMLTAFLYILRATVGYQHTESQVSISRLASDTGYSRRAMVGAVNDLEKKGMIKIGFRRSGVPSQMMVNDVSYWDQDI